jgi:hypothetical protein
MMHQKLRLKVRLGQRYIYIIRTQLYVVSRNSSSHLFSDSTQAEFLSHITISNTITIVKFIVQNPTLNPKMAYNIQSTSCISSVLAEKRWLVLACIFYADYFPFKFYTHVTTGASLIHFTTQPFPSYAI